MSVEMLTARRPESAGTARSQSDEALERALAPVKDQLAAVSDRVLFQLTDPAARAVVYLVTAGGKRLRPALVLLAGAAGPKPDPDALIDTAAAVELIHTATLIHDDIIDQSPLRRSQPAFHERWGTERAVLMGDYLYSTAFMLLARLQHPRVMETMAGVCRELCRGELREVEARYRLDLTEAEYLAIIQDKTASLIAGCCRSGALLGGSDPNLIERFATFGRAFGLAFQIIDDCLDLTGDAAVLGKAVLTDLDKGALSLPIIYLTSTLDAKTRDELFAPLNARTADQAFLARIAEAAQACGAIARAQATAQALLNEAQEALSPLQSDGLADACRALTAYAVSRRH